jgi:hypothetical protein
MYISGDITTFESRLHQLPETNSELNHFKTEGNTYLSIIDEALRTKWNREFAKRKDILDGGVNYYINDALDPLP